MEFKKPDTTANNSDIEKPLEKLPADYAAFLLQHNGLPKPGRFRIDDERTGTIKLLYELVRERWVKNGMLPIGIDSELNKIWIGVLPSNYGAIFLTEKDKVIQLAKDFSSFINDLGIKMHSSILGALSQHKEINAWWVSSGIEIPYFNGSIYTFIYSCEPGSDEKFLEDADKATSNFLELTAADRVAASGKVMEYKDEVYSWLGDDDINEDIASLENESDIWAYVHPDKIYVRRNTRDNQIYLKISCECDWEEEHGLQMEFRNGNILTKVGEQS